MTHAPRSAAAYRTLLSAACTSAGECDALWNQRFIAALHIHGLMLSTDPGVGNCYPDCMALCAPSPFPGSAISWPLYTYVVWQPAPRT